jgi:MazG family protein
MPSRTKKSRSPKKSGVSRRKAPKAGKISAGEWFERLVAVQKRLRAPQGCPWDREQTHTTLRPYLIEEAYEVLDALDAGDDAKFAEEMGDLLLQVVFHSEIARAEGRFSIADVVKEIHDKMVRRHPHVFGKARAKDSQQVLKNWERIKAEERQEKERLETPQQDGGPKTTAKPTSVVDGVSRGLPAMLEGLQLTRKASRAGFDWHNADGIFEKVREEMAELRHALAENDATKAEEELGDLFFATVNLARFVQVDPEIALKKANAKFQRRFKRMESAALERERPFAELQRQEMEALWDAVKHEENAAVEGRQPGGAKPEGGKSPSPKVAASNAR